MDKLNPTQLPPLGNHIVLGVKSDVWTKVLNYINSQTEHINLLEEELAELKREITNQNEIYNKALDSIRKDIKVIAEALGGVYEEE